MNTEELQIEILGKEIEFQVEFNFYKGEPRITHLPPEQCQEGCPDEYKLCALYFIGSEQGRRKLYDASWLLDELSEEIEEILEDIREEY